MTTAAPSMTINTQEDSQKFYNEAIVAWKYFVINGPKLRILGTKDEEKQILELKTREAEEMAFVHRVITLNCPKVRKIGDDILDYSVDVNFNGNDCVDGDFEGWQIDELKFVIKHCCKNPKQMVKVDIEDGRSRNNYTCYHYN